MWESRSKAEAPALRPVAMDLTGEDRTAKLDTREDFSQRSVADSNQMAIVQAHGRLTWVDTEMLALVILWPLLIGKWGGKVSLDTISNLMVHAAQVVTKMGLVSTSFFLQRARPSAPVHQLFSSINHVLRVNGVRARLRHVTCRGR